MADPADAVGEALDLILCSEQNRACFAALSTICLNILANPAEPKFRRLKLGNAALGAKVFGVPGGRAVLAALGFVEEASVAGGEAALVLAQGLELPAEAVARITEMLDVVGGPPPPPAAASPAPAAAGGGSGGGGGGGSFFSGMGLSPAERERRAKESEERARSEAEEKKKLLAQAALNQKEREANEALHGGVKASHKTTAKESVVKKLFVARGAPCPRAPTPSCLLSPPLFLLRPSHAARTPLTRRPHALPAQ